MDDQFICIPDWVCNHPDFRPLYLNVYRALLAFLRDGNDHPFRGEIAREARVGAGKVIEAIAWLEEVGAIRIIPDPAYASGRRFVSTTIRTGGGQ